MCLDQPCEGCSFFVNNRCSLPRDIIFRVPDDWKPTLRKLREDTPSGQSFAEFVREILENWTKDNSYASNVDLKLEEARKEKRLAEARIANLEKVKKAEREAKKQQTLVLLKFEDVWEGQKRNAESFLNRSLLSHGDWKEYVTRSKIKLSALAESLQMSQFELEQKILEKLRGEK